MSFKDSMRELFSSHAVPAGTPEHLRGPQRISFEDALRDAAKYSRGDGGKTYRWGLRDLPYDTARRGLRLVGAQGSGKTTLIRMLLKDGILNYLGASEPVRCYMFDAKNDYIRDLPQLGLRQGTPVYHVHPFAPTGMAWDIAKDLTEDIALETFSHLLFPESAHPTGNQHFFERAQRLILQAVLLSFRRIKGDAWTLRDAVLALLDQDDLVRIISATDHPINNTVLRDYFPKNNPELSSNIRAGLLGAASEFITVAARWHWAARDPKRVFTLRDWLAKPSIIVFGYEHAYEHALKGLNRALFGRISQLLLREGHHPDRITWILLDELAAPGKLTGIKELFAEGRDKGIAVLLGFQEMSHLEEHYTREGAHSIISLCQLHGVLAVGSYETRVWAQNQFGFREVKETSFTDNQAVRRASSALVTEGEIEALPFPDTATDTGVHGFFITLGKDVYQVAMTWPELTAAVPPLIQGPLPTEVDPEQNLDELPQWSDDERKALGLAPRKGPKPKRDEDDANVF